VIRIVCGADTIGGGKNSLTLLASNLIGIKQIKQYVPHFPAKLRLRQDLDHKPPELHPPDCLLFLTIEEGAQAGQLAHHQQATDAYLDGGKASFPTNHFRQLLTEDLGCQD